MPGKPESKCVALLLERGFKLMPRELATMLEDTLAKILQVPKRPPREREMPLFAYYLAWTIARDDRGTLWIAVGEIDLGPEFFDYNPMAALLLKIRDIQELIRKVSTA